MRFFDRLKEYFRRTAKPKWGIVIDPGHGGTAPGAVNKKYGYMEKNINLHIATFMCDYIKTDYPEIIPATTRITDKTISLPDRCYFANTWRFGVHKDGLIHNRRADCFISIHTNARRMKGRYGLEIETFFFRGSEPGWELASKIQEALLLCKYLGIPVINRGVKIGQRRGADGELKDFYVLRNTDMPAVLVEVGFLSDDEEAEILIKPENQRIMGEAIISAVVGWLEER